MARVIHKYETPIWQVGRGYYTGRLYTLNGQGFFGDLARNVLPLLSKALGRELGETGRDILGEFEKGTSLGKAVRGGIGRSYHRVKEKIKKKLTGRGRKRKSIRKRSVVKRRKPSAKKRRRRKRKAIKRQYDNFNF